jgi:hypothetical protein
MKKFDFLHSTNFKLLNQIKENSVNNLISESLPLLSGAATVVTRPGGQQTKHRQCV